MASKSNSSSGLPTKDRILDTAFRLFRRFGIRKVTIEEIAQETGVSKMTFYKYYRNKNDLVLTILNREIEYGRAQFQEIMAAPVPFIEKVEQIILQKIEAGKKLGEPFLKDIYAGDPEIYQSLMASSQEFKDEVVHAFLEEQSKGSLRPELNMAFVEYMMRKMQEMYLDPELQDLYSDQLSLIRDLVEFLFYGLSPYRGDPH